jgi:hypothetical protein
MDVIINSYNMSELEGIREALPGASAKYVTDLILDAIIYQWVLSIPHSTKSMSRRKFRLSERHFTFVEKYAAQRHISMTIATNLILNDYFSSRIVTNKPEVAQITPTLAEKEPTQKSQDSDKPKSLQGMMLLQNLKTKGD